MSFKMPKTLDGLSLKEIQELHEAAFAEAQELNKIEDDKITDEESAQLIELVGHIDTISAREAEVAAADAEAAEKLAAARGRLAEAPAEEAAEDEAPAEGDESEPAAEVEVVEEKEAVLASAKRGSFSSRAASKAPAPKVEDEAPKGALSLIASANVPGFSSGQELKGFDELAKAFIGRGKSFAGGGGRKGKVELRNPGRYELSPNAQRFSVAKLEKADSALTITENMSAEDQFDLIQKAAKESRLPGGSLLAAGDWCAPSEQIWEFCELETMDGLLTIPEMSVRRGGVTWTPGPQLNELLSDPNFGFAQTETEAEAGTVKPCYDISCPEWDEIRLEALGFCLKAGILTNHAYPELIRRVLSLALIAHARRVNATTIARISAAIGAPTAFASVNADLFSATSDLLSAIELNVVRIRETHAMAEGATVEGVFPIWTRAVIRSELSRRTGVDMMNVTNQMITQWFATRGVSAQFVRDYQDINNGAATTEGGTADWTRFPDTVEFMLYPAGAFVRLGDPVIELDSVYDTDGLTTNTHTAAFLEESFGLLNACGTGAKVSVSLGNLSGLTGAAAIGDPSAVAPV